MGWHINLVKNDVRINATIATELKITLVYGYDASVVCRGGTYYLNFDSDHMEHMDFLSHLSIQKLLKRHKVKGDVCFASYEGDNKGKSWGYRFDGKGGMVKLVGELVFKPK